VNDYFTTRSGRHIRVLDPRPEDVYVPDIAWALSRICRFGGHAPRHDSVAQHSVMVSELCPPELALTGLLHDAPEAYIGDVIGPLKHALPELMEIEARWERAIEQAMTSLHGAGLFAERALTKMHPHVKEADHLAFHIEWENLFVGEDRREPLHCHSKVGRRVVIHPAEEAYALFEHTYVALTGRSMHVR
jgi:hypothetical protein